MTRKPKFDRRKEDLGNFLCLEHVNLRVPDQTLAAWFYVSGLGLTRDPFVDFGSFNTWINAGAQQFHLPTGKAQVLRGEIELVVPNVDQLERRLERVAGQLKGTQFQFVRSAKAILATCPWGNKIRCLGETASQPTGLPGILFYVSPDALPGIERFYNQVFSCPTKRLKRRLEVTVGIGQKLVFAARKNYHTAYDGHHIAIYCPDFSRPYETIKDHGWISEESDQHQYRFEQIFDPLNGEPLFQIEHEVRSLHHPMFNRNLINRNPAQTFRSYQRGRDQYYPGG